MSRASRRNTPRVKAATVMVGAEIVVREEAKASEAHSTVG